MPSSELTPTEVWSLILEESRKVINPQTFKTWLEPTEAIGLSDDRLLVSVKNQFAVDYIEGQYGTVLARIAAGESLETIADLEELPQPGVSEADDHRVERKADATQCQLSIYTRQRRRPGARRGWGTAGLLPW